MGGCKKSKRVKKFTQLCYLNYSSLGSRDKACIVLQHQLVLFIPSRKVSLFSGTRCLWTSARQAFRLDSSNRWAIHYPTSTGGCFSLRGGVRDKWDSSPKPAETRDTPGALLCRSDKGNHSGACSGLLCHERDYSSRGQSMRA